MDHSCYFCHVFVMFLCVCLLLPCGNLLGKGLPLGSLLCCPIVSLLLSHWYPGSDVVLNCIDSWSLSSLLLYNNYICLSLTSCLGKLSTSLLQKRLTN